MCGPLGLPLADSLPLILSWPAGADEYVPRKMYIDWARVYKLEKK